MEKEDLAKIARSSLLDYQNPFYLAGVNLMIPIEFSGRVRVNCFLMVP